MSTLNATLANVEPCGCECTWMWASNQWNKYTPCQMTDCQCDTPAPLVGVVEQLNQSITTTTPCYRFTSVIPAGTSPAYQSATGEASSA